MAEPSLVRSCTACGSKNRTPVRHFADAGRCGKCGAALGPVADPVEADASMFAAVSTQLRVPVLVDFWAAWCGPCRVAGPLVARLAREMAGRAVVLKVDTEAHPELAARFDVRGIPNFVVLKGGRMVSQHAGVSPPEVMRRWVEEAAATS